MKTDTLALAAVRARPSDFLALTKPRLNLLVVVTAAVGFYLASAGAPALSALLHAVVGTALVAGGAAALNQYLERDIDALMLRTRERPLPDCRVQPGDARVFGLVLAAVGLACLLVAANPLAALVALVTVATYILIYTPLKRRTPLAMLVGAVPGALPPMIGWAAATGSLDAGAWALFAIVFFWQMPHFLAIAWMYREDFGRAALPLVPVLGPDGRSTARQMVGYTLALLAASALPAAAGLGGGAYLVGAAALGLGFLALTIRFAAGRTTSRARSVFLGSIVYLPLLWVLLIVERAL